MNADIAESLADSPQILDAAVLPELRAGADGKPAAGGFGGYAAGDRPAQEGRAVEVDQVGER
jgi:hypothetical protein